MGDEVSERFKNFLIIESERIKYPSTYAVSLKNLQNAVLQNIKKYGNGCFNERTTNIRKSHVRNRKLLDLPFKKAKCCTKIYNAVIDRQKLKKLQKYNLSRPVRVITSDLEPEAIKECDFLESKPEESPSHLVNEFHQITDDESDDASADIWLKACSSGSLTECSGCSTIGPLKKQKFHEVPRLRWQDLLHGSQVEYCKNTVVKVLAKYKGHPNATLKLKKFKLK